MPALPTKPVVASPALGEETLSRSANSSVSAAEWLTHRLSTLPEVLALCMVLGLLFPSQLSAQSDPATAPPVITVQPIAVTAIEGTTATLSVTATGGQLSYGWRNSFGQTFGADESVLTFTNVQLTNAGNYRVRVTNTLGQVFSSSVELKVVQCYPDLPTPVIGNVRRVGSQVYLDIVNTGNIFNAGNFPQGLKDSIPSLPSCNGINPASRSGVAIYDDGGNLLAESLCSSVNSSMTGFNWPAGTNDALLPGAITLTLTDRICGGTVTSAPVLLGVGSAPIITGQPTNRLARVGVPTSLAVTAEGALPLTYQWFQAGSQVSFGGNDRVLSVRPGTNRLAFADYSVVVGNRFGSVTSHIALISEARDLRFTNLPVRIIANLGDTVQITGEAEGEGPVSYLWQFPTTVNNPNPNLIVRGSTSMTNAILNLTNLSPTNAGTYFVQATDSVGRTNQVVRVWLDNPRAVIRPLELTGWNRDVVWEAKTNASGEGFDPFGNLWQEEFAPLSARSDAGPNGLPSHRQFVSRINTNIVFRFAPYDQRNVLWLTPGGTNLLAGYSPTNRLYLAQPQVLRKLATLAATAGGATNGSLVVLFADGSRSPALNYHASDWWYGATDLVSIGRLRPRPTDTAGAGGAGLFESVVDLQEMGLSERLISGFEFVIPKGSLACGIFAVSGEPAEAFVPPQITAAKLSDDGSLSLQLNANLPANSVLEFSNELRSWQSVVEPILNPDGTGFVVPLPAGTDQIYYRISFP